MAIAPAGAAGQDCREGEDVVIAANAHAHVIGDVAGCDDREGPSYFDVRAGLRGGKLRSLDYQGEEIITIHSLKLRGRYVAYVSSWHEGEEEASELRLMNVRTGASHGLDAVGYSGPAPWGRYVLKPNGSTAWIVDEAYGDEFGPDSAVVVRSCPRQRCLRANPRAPRPRTLDDAPRIALSSLQLTGSKLSWIRAGVRRRATLR